MKRKQSSEGQIIGDSKEAEADAVVTELCRKHGMSSVTYYAWKAKFGGLKMSDAKHQVQDQLDGEDDEACQRRRLTAKRPRSGMTDMFLLKTYERLFGPRMGSVFDRT